MAGKKDAQIVVLKDVRLSFPHLHEPQERENDDGSTRLTFNAAFMIEKDNPLTKANLAAVKAAAQAARKQRWGDDEKKWPKIPSHKMCLRDGDNSDHTDREEYQGHYFINASTNVDKPPRVLTNRKDSDDDWIPAEPGKKGNPYAGCYVNAILRIWAQDDKNGKRINAALQTVQFRRDGEAFGNTPADPNDYLTEDDVSYEGELGDDDDGDGDDDGLL